MSVYRVLVNGITALPLKNKLFNKDLNSCFRKINLNHERNFRQAYPRFLKIMKLRRKIIGPDKTRKRNEWYDWNYNAELYAFNKRLQENISDDTLRCIFVHDSYIEIEEQKRKDMDVHDVSLNLKSNSALVVLGQDVMSKYLMRYLRHCFRLMPEEGICAVHDYLTSDNILAHVSSNIGTKDLIFSAEYPPGDSTLAVTLKAVIGGIVTCDSVKRAENFVLDFICPQLIGKDVLEIWEFDYPMSILNGILMKQGREPPESRLIFESGRNTIEAIYHVGLYSNKEFLGKGAGETLAFAEEMAAYDSLRRMFELVESARPLPFGETAKKIEFNLDKEHLSITELYSDSKDVKVILS